MNTKHLFPVLFLLLTLQAGALQRETFTLNGFSKEVAKGEIIVKYRKTATVFQRSTLKARYSTTVRKTINLSTPYQKNEFEVIQLPAGMSVNQAVSIYSSLPEVEHVQPNYVRHAFLVPDDTLYGSQWGLPQIYAPQAWDSTQGSTSVVVAVIDTGVYTAHPDLTFNVLSSSGYDFANSDAAATDDNGHGTHVAGIIAAVSDNGAGIAGVSWNSKILPVKVLDANGDGYDSDIADGIRYAADHNARIINMSFGDTQYPPYGGILLEAACVYADDKGCLLVCASGNGYYYDRYGDPISFRTDAVSYPAAFTTCVAVGATDSNDNRASFSNYGSQLDLVAPGVGILSTVPDINLGTKTSLGGNKMWDASGYDYADGTSMATPFVCGVAALILSYSSDLTNEEVLASLRESATDVGTAGFDIYTGWGRLNATTSVIYVPPPSVASVLNYPNPFDPNSGEETVIDIPQSISGSYTRLKIYNIAGDLIAAEEKNTSSYYIKWDGKNDQGTIVASGIYLYTIETNNGSARGKLTLIKQ